MTGIPLHRVVISASVLLLGVLAGSLGTWQLFGRSEKLLLPEIPLHAVGTTTGETFAMATGPVDENSEGLFLIDFLTGELQCWVPDYRTGRFYGSFKTNVTDDLPVDRSKKPRYLLSTGGISPRGSQGNSKPADTIVYVLDENTGNFASYTFLWNRSSASAGNTQQGLLTKIEVQTARTTVIAP